MTDQTSKQGLLRILFDGPPGPEGGRFVECEDAAGRGVSCGEWSQQGDFWVLTVTELPVAVEAPPGAAPIPTEEARMLAAYLDNVDPTGQLYIGDSETPATDEQVNKIFEAVDRANPKGQCNCGGKGKCFWCLTQKLRTKTTEAHEPIREQLHPWLERVHQEGAPYGIYDYVLTLPTLASMEAPKPTVMAALGAINLLMNELKQAQDHLRSKHNALKLAVDTKNEVAR